MNADRPDPSTNGHEGVRPASRPDTRRAAPGRPESGQVSRLDRVTLQLGVVVAVVIALCSYAVSATSLYALGVQAGYSNWQAAAVPVVADGPAIYGMFRIVSRSRRGAKGAGYGWLLVIAGTLASIGGNVAHAQPDLVAQAIAAAIPMAVLAMLEGLKGHAVSGHPDSNQLTVRRAAPRPVTNHGGVLDSQRLGQLATRLPGLDGAAGVGQRLAAAYAQGRPDGGSWTVRTLAEAAGCGRSSAASFLQLHRQEERP
jgi:hypothetical protein